jgi:hypothetical protein
MIQISKTVSELIEGRKYPGRNFDKRQTSIFDVASKKEASELQCFFSENVHLDSEIPSVIIARNFGVLEDLFAGIATYKTVLSPLSAYSNIFDEQIIGKSFHPETFKFSQPSPTQLSFYSGLILGECLTVSFNLFGDNSRVSYSYGRRSLAYVICRAQLLYGPIDLQVVAERWDSVKELFERPSSGGLSDMVVSIAKNSENITAGNEYRGFVTTFLAHHLEKTKLTAEPLRKLTERISRLGTLEDVLEGPYDKRIDWFINAGKLISGSEISNEEKAILLASSANTINPGSLSHYGLLVKYLQDLPSVLIWYSIFAFLTKPKGSVANEFDGLIRKIVRDLTRSWAPIDVPSSDLCFEELLVLNRGELTSKSVRPEISKYLSVSLLPGVTISTRTHSEIDSQTSSKTDDSTESAGKQAVRDFLLTALVKLNSENSRNTTTERGISSDKTPTKTSVTKARARRPKTKAT